MSWMTVFFVLVALSAFNGFLKLYSDRNDRQREAERSLFGPDGHTISRWRTEQLAEDYQWDAIRKFLDAHKGSLRDKLCIKGVGELYIGNMKRLHSAGFRILSRGEEGQNCPLVTLSIQKSLEDAAGA